VGATSIQTPAHHKRLISLTIGRKVLVHGVAAPKFSALVLVSVRECKPYHEVLWSTVSSAACSKACVADCQYLSAHSSCHPICHATLGKGWITHRMCHVASIPPWAFPRLDKHQGNNELCSHCHCSNCQCHRCCCEQSAMQQL